MNDLEKAEALLKAEGYSYVLVKGDKVIKGRRRGIAPLIELIDGGADLKGFSAADKIVGKAAAMAYVYAGVERIYAEVLSSSAAEVLKAYKVAYSYGTAAERIINRTGDGTCPMEITVTGITSPVQAVEALREKLKTMRGE